MATDITTAAPADDEGWGSVFPGDSANAGDVADPFAGVDIDAEGVDANAVDRGGNIDLPGKYHLEITLCEAKSAEQSLRKERPEFFIRCEVLKSVPGQSPQGSSLLANIEVPTAEDRDVQWGDKPAYPILQARLLSFLEKCKVIGKTPEGAFVDPETKSAKVNLRTVATRLKGKQFIGKVIAEKFTRKDGTEGSKIKLDPFHPASACDAPENATTPMNDAALQVLGLRRAVVAAPSAKGNGSQAGRGGQTAFQHSAPAAEGDGEIEI